MSLLSYDAALLMLLEHVEPLNAVQMPVIDTDGYRLASHIRALVDVPRFDNSQMDGYAVRYADVSAGSTAVHLEVVGTAAAGGSNTIVVERGAAAKIFTGAPLPLGADTVVPIEDVSAIDKGMRIVLTSAIEKGQFVRSKGEDVTVGEVVGKREDRINPGTIALLSSVGQHEVEVFRRAKVVIITNGDELVGAAVKPEDLKFGQIFESNSGMLAALVRRAQADVTAVKTSLDSLDQLVAAIRDLISEHAPDLILCTGGVSVGDRDYVRAALNILGEEVFWRAAIRPGKPILYGKVGGSHFLGLPGNPASTLVTFELFARPLLEKLHGVSKPAGFLPTRLSGGLKHQPGRRSFVRARTVVTASGLCSAALGEQGSHYVTSLAGANSLLVVPEDCASLDAGETCECLLIGPLSVE